MIDTKIEWCDSTVNPTSGCDGCELWVAGKGGTCYAGNFHSRYAGSNKAYPGPFEILTQHPGRMAKAAAWPDLTGTDRPDKPWLNGLPRHIFISDMSDAMSRAVPFEYLQREIIDHVDSPAGRRHFWLWLTKQPKRMAALSQWLRDRGIAWPDNLMAMTSVTSQATLRRVADLVKVRCRWRGLSVEPLLGYIFAIPFGEIDAPRERWPDCTKELVRRDISGVIVGGESGPRHRPCDIDWIRVVRDECQDAGVPCFIKQLGSTVRVDYYEKDDAIREWASNQRRVVMNPNLHGGFHKWGPIDGQPHTGAYFLCRMAHKGGDPSDWPPGFERREWPAVATAEVG